MSYSDICEGRSENKIHTSGSEFAAVIIDSVCLSIRTVSFWYIIKQQNTTHWEYNITTTVKSQLVFLSLLSCGASGAYAPSPDVEEEEEVINTLRTGSFKLFKRPFPGFLKILTL